jgi:hypothetical protein
VLIESVMSDGFSAADAAKAVRRGKLQLQMTISKQQTNK